MANMHNFPARPWRAMGLLLLSILWVGASLGCAAFAGKQLPKVKTFPAISGTKPTVQVQLRFKQYMNGKPISFGAKMAEKGMQNKIVQVFKKSGVFTNAAADLRNPDLDVKVDLTDEGEANMGMAFLTGLTLFIIPSKAVDTYKLCATVMDASGKQVGSYQLQDSVTQWQQILLLPLLPFKMTPIVASGVQTNLFRNLIAKMIKDKVIH